MRALVLTTSYPIGSGRLSGRFVQELLAGLVPHGWFFEVITPAPREGGAHLTRAGIRVEAVPFAGHRAGLAHDGGIPDRIAAAPWLAACVPGMTRGLARAAARRLHEMQFDLVWSHWLFPAGWIGAGLARRRGVPHLVTAHGGDVHLVERLARVPGGRAVLRARFAASHLSAPAARTAERVQCVLGGPVAVAPLPADAAPVAERAARSGGPLAVLFLGRFEPIKGAALLLEAAAQPGMPPLEIVMAGAGTEEVSLRARAARLGVRVHFAGVLEGTARRHALAHADVLVVPSRRTRGGRGEGLPHAATLALAAGLPVVTADGGALADVVRTHGAGAVFDAEGDPRAAAGRLAAVLARLSTATSTRAALRRGALDAGAAHRPERALPAWARLLARAGCGADGTRPGAPFALEAAQ